MCVNLSPSFSHDQQQLLKSEELGLAQGLQAGASHRYSSRFPSDWVGLLLSGLSSSLAHDFHPSLTACHSVEARDYRGGTKHLTARYGFLTHHKVFAVNDPPTSLMRMDGNAFIHTQGTWSARSQKTTRQIKLRGSFILSYLIK